MQFGHISPSFRKIIPDVIKDYPDAKEEMDSTFPTPFRTLIQSTFLVNTEHAHDLKTRRSITGFIGYVGSNPVI